MKLQCNLTPNRASRNGFTLLEVTIALGLGLFLMLAIFQTFLIAARYRNLAEENLPFGVGLANAMRDLRGDLNGIALDCTQFANLTGRTNATNPRDNRLQTNLQDSFSTGSEWVQFACNGDYLAMTTKSWNPRFGQLPASILPSGNSLVIWWQYSNRPPKIEAWINKSLPISKQLIIPENPEGLIRTQVWLDSHGKEHQRSEVIHPGVRDLKFILHNGSSEQKQSSNKTLPIAIEVQCKVDGDLVQQWIEVSCEPWSDSDSSRSQLLGAKNASL